MRAWNQAIRVGLVVVGLGLGPVAGEARAGEPTAAELLARYDATMGPKTFDSLMVMVAHRQDDTTRTYKFRALRGTGDKVRLWFFEPASAKGQEMLRSGENMWVYMPNLKRAVRIASRDSFQGGDFNNADALRVNYVADYTPKMGASEDPALWLMELAAKSADAAYDHIKLWIRKEDSQPARAEFYAASGKRLRKMEYSEVKDFRGLKRPSRLVMTNELAVKRFSEMQVLDMKVNIEVPEQKFVLDELGR